MIRKFNSEHNSKRKLREYGLRLSLNGYLTFRIPSCKSLEYKRELEESNGQERTDDIEPIVEGFLCIRSFSDYRIPPFVID